MGTKLQIGQIVKTRMRLMISPYLYSKTEKNLFEVPEGTVGEVVDIKWKSQKGNRFMVDFLGYGKGFTQFSLLAPCTISERCDDCVFKFRCFTNKEKWGKVICKK